MNEFGKKLAASWGDFVDCEGRSRTLTPFLAARLPAKDYEVIDLCAGIGCEARAIAAEGRHVIANEIDPSLREIGSTFCLAHERVHWSSVNWLELSAHFGPRRFGGAFLLGNSFSLLLNEQERIRAANEFAAVTKPGGSLIIDERDFRYILHDRDRILSGTFRFSGRVIYCGNRVVGHPVGICDERVVFRYSDTQSGQILGHLEMYPFKEGEIVRVLDDAGFELLETSYDLGMAENGPCDFVTYHFRRRS